MLHHIFSTPVWRAQSGLAAEQLAELREHLIRLRANAPGDARSNRGGWHSTGNLLDAGHPQFAFLRDLVTKALFAYIGDACEHRGEIELALTAWTVINRAGDYNAPHDHAANFLSGALYVSIPPGMRGGAIVFQHPRPDLSAHFTEGMRRLGIRPPWIDASVSVMPAAGEILVFPSWLTHLVEPFECDEAGAERIVISFNATV